MTKFPLIFAQKGYTSWGFQIGRLWMTWAFPRFWRPWAFTKGPFPVRVGWDTSDLGGQ